MRHKTTSIDKTNIVTSYVKNKLFVTFYRKKKSMGLVKILASKTG